jgi:NAD-dependent DNA ligase
MNEGVITKLYDSGLKTIQQIISAPKERLLLIPTIKDKMAERIVTNLQSALSSISLADFLTGTGIFGMGIAKKKIELLLNVYPDIVTKQYSKEDICQVQGFSEKTATKVIEGASKFLSVYEPLRPFIHIVFPSQHSSNPASKEDNLLFQGKTLVFSKFRDEKIKAKILSLGGNVSESVSSKTFAVITQNVNDTSSKIDKAKKLGLPIWSVENFFSYCETNS